MCIYVHCTYSCELDHVCTFCGYTCLSFVMNCLCILAFIVCGMCFFKLMDTQWFITWELSSLVFAIHQVCWFKNVLVYAIRTQNSACYSCVVCMFIVSLCLKCARAGAELPSHRLLIKTGFDSHGARSSFAQMKYASTSYCKQTTKVNTTKVSITLIFVFVVVSLQGENSASGS